MDAGELLRVYDDQVRGSFVDRPPAGWTVERDGPVARALTTHDGFAMLVHDVSDLPAEQLAAVVERTVAFFRGAGARFEWKTFDHDRADLVPLLLAAGAVPQPRESLVMGEAAVLARPPELPDGLAMREVTGRGDMERIASMESQVWGEDWSWLADDLSTRTEAGEMRVFVVEDDDLVVSAAWLVPVPGTAVAGLWGGSTLAEYRGRGIYRALVAQRARLAVTLGYQYLQVDASEDSRPVLERLGLVEVGGTTPYLLA